MPLQEISKFSFDSKFYNSTKVDKSFERATKVNRLSHKQKSAQPDFDTGFTHLLERFDGYSFLCHTRYNAIPAIKMR